MEGFSHALCGGLKPTVEARRLDTFSRQCCVFFFLSFFPLIIVIFLQAMVRKNALPDKCEAKKGWFVGSGNVWNTKQSS